jgi:hypothetical protein
VNILDAIMNANDGAAMRQIGSQVGLGEEQTASALSALVPALAAGFQQQVQTPEGLAGLMSALSTGSHQRYIDDPAALAGQGAVQDGNGILGHVLGSKDVSRDVASRAAAQSGLSADVMKRLLPLAAAVMMGAFARSQSAGSASLQGGLAGAGSLAGGGLAGGGGLMDMLTSLADRNRDGSIVDDIGGMLGRTLGGGRSS